MTALELCEKVLAIGEIDDAGAAGELDTEMLYKLAPKLARMLKKAIEQRDGWIASTDEDEFDIALAINYNNAELDAIASGEPEKRCLCGTMEGDAEDCPLHKKGAYAPKGDG